MTDSEGSDMSVDRRCGVGREMDKGDDTGACFSYAWIMRAVVGRSVGCRCLLSCLVNTCGERRDRDALADTLETLLRIGRGNVNQSLEIQAYLGVYGDLWVHSGDRARRRAYRSNSGAGKHQPITSPAEPRCPAQVDDSF
ncbi:hypothetical protein OF83DRAFT_1130194 [Amylostereum chailletii]|nr:hypothetical protein OF83DRAFT_1130194 [Amylostereum chailletii]